MEVHVISNEELQKKFDEIDTNHGGYILFDEVNGTSDIYYWSYT